MPSAQPIKSYLEAVDLYRAGDREAALQKLTEALGGEKPSAVIEANIDRLLKLGSLPNDAVLRIISTEVTKHHGEGNNH
jgi:hypothetical protein